MSLFSQLAILILIGGVTAILLRSNRDLERVCEEGEHFVDEWSLHLARKAEMEIEKEAEKESRREAAIKNEEMTGPGFPSRMGDARPGSEPWRTKTGRPEPGRPEPWRPEPGISETFLEPGTLLPLIQVLDGDDKPVRQVVVDRVPFLIGRDPGCHLVIADLCVARQHCRIVQEGAKFFLLDNGTRNRLSTNIGVVDRIQLIDDCRIRIGETTLCVRFMHEKRTAYPL